MISIMVTVTVAYFLAAARPLQNMTMNSSYIGESFPPNTSMYSPVNLKAARSIENCRVSCVPVVVYERSGGSLKDAEKNTIIGS